MRSDIPAPSDPTLQVADGVQVLLALSGGPLELSRGTATTLDLTPYAGGIRQRFADCTLELLHDGELAGASRPKPRQAVSIRRGGAVLWAGVVESVSEATERGTSRRISMTARRRDAFPAWRELRRVTKLYSVGTELAAIARDVAAAAGLDPSEYQIPNLGVQLAHDMTQLADINAWDMLELIGQPAIAEPYVDGSGVLKLISRDVRRPATLQLPWSQVVRLAGEKARPAVTEVKVRWLDPKLREVVQREQVLASEQLVVGFFKWSSTKQVFWSQDRTLRARNCRLEVKQSINDGGILSFLPQGSETFEQVSATEGRITATYSAWNAVVIPHEVALLIAAHQIPEPVQVGPTGTGTTMPWYKGLAIGLSETLLFGTLMRIGQGIYDVVGQPYDYVHAVNETDAVDQNAADEDRKLEVIENDLVPSQEASEGLAVAELFYRARSASRASLVIADDPRIERGDVLGLPDGRRFYVLEGSRDLTRGASALLQLEGFWT